MVRVNLDLNLPAPAGEPEGSLSFSPYSRDLEASAVAQPSLLHDAAGDEGIRDRWAEGLPEVKVFQVGNEEPEPDVRVVSEREDEGPGFDRPAQLHSVRIEPAFVTGNFLTSCCEAPESVVASDRLLLCSERGFVTGDSVGVEADRRDGEGDDSCRGKSEDHERPDGQYQPSIAGLSEAEGSSAPEEVPMQVEVNTRPRKRLRTIGELRTRKLEKNAELASPSDRVAIPEGTPESWGGSGEVNPNMASKDDLGENVSTHPEAKMEMTIGALEGIAVTPEEIVRDATFQPHEKLQAETKDILDGEKKKSSGLKGAMPGRRRRRTVLLNADEPVVRPRVVRSHPLAPSSGARVDHSLKLEVQQASDFGTSTGVSEDRDCRKLEGLSAPQSPGGESTLQAMDDIQVPDQSPDAGTGHRPSLNKKACKNEEYVYNAPPLQQQGYPESEASEVSHAKKEEPTAKQGPAKSRKLRRLNEPQPLRNIHSTTSVKPAEFIRPTVKKPTGIAFSKKKITGAGVHPTNNEFVSSFQDTSIERLHREATCSKLWQTPGDSELQRVPGSFASADEYVHVFEPLLFEECRAQLHNVWEELLEGSSTDVHAAVSIKKVDRRERGWYDVVLMPLDSKRQLHFKEGDVAVLSTPKPGSGSRRKGRVKSGKVESTEEGTIVGCVAGFVRRFVPVDVRDLPGAVFHFHVSQEDMTDLSGGEKDGVKNSGHVLQQLQQVGGTWYLTGLGSITTTQREYSALHLLQHFRPQMMNAILQPCPELFPGYADQAPPAMPDCFTPPYIKHLHSSFNAPQLASIQWAAAHTAAGSPETGSTPTSAGGQPWPFTLVQGPPGTGKTHTVWGMLNVIHLVQYQRYYAALLQKLAPGSLSTPEGTIVSNGTERDTDGDEWGTIDEVLQKMDRSLARVLPKLCPKPRMLVCAPSNAATDELLSRVLDRGFIDGEMRVYRPDVARVGVDTSSRAAQAVSVERRTEQLLAMGQHQVVGWLQQLRVKEVGLAQHVAGLQKDLIDAAATARSQGVMGINPEILAARDQMRDGKLQQLAALVEERDKVLVEMSRLFIIEGKFRPGSNFRPEDARRKLEASFANEAEIVFTTVSSSGRKIFSSLTHGFDMVVIDEAAQASEVSVLPPLSLRAARCVLVGDPQQLPATVISRAADTRKYSRSLFERFQQAGCPAILLSVQYRMHPQIREFPSRYFYQGKLVDSESVRGLPEEIYHQDPLLQPYLFFDISHGRESHGGSVSYQNKMEAHVAIRLYQHLQKVLAGAAGDAPSAKVSVGIITPYKQQLTCLEKEFVAVIGSNSTSKGVYINTVDAFQGQERDVIMMSCVRASSHGVGFVADIRRMNVAVTRARRSLWVIGNASALMQSEDWAALLSDARDRRCFVSTATCVARGILPETPMGTLGAPQMGSTGLLHHPRSGVLLSRGRGMVLPPGSRHSVPGNHHYGVPRPVGDGPHWRARQLGAEPMAVRDRGPDGREVWQRPGYGRSCRGQRDAARPGFGSSFQHPGRRSKGL